MKRYLPLIFAALLPIACGPNNDGGPPAADAANGDVGADVGARDVGTTDVGAPDMGSDDDTASGLGLCEPCRGDAECGDSDDLCVAFSDEEASCGISCDENEPCPAGYLCAVLDDEQMIQQCIPENLTCVNRCVDVACGNGEVCDPRDGTCQRAQRLCETDCALNALCGDGPEDICINMPGIPEGERSCLTGCDPEAATAQCPANFVCLALDAENDPNAGICFPFRGTCVDRCADVDCPTGQNCDQLTGECVAPAYGSCDGGCTRDAECGGQDDVCLDLGINDGAHCWQECSEADCPGGYECRGLIGATLRICIPLGNDCSACEDNACFPDSVCNPVDDICEPLAVPCATDDECDAGFVCDPTSSSCVEVGRSCDGATWALDCDNSVTKCTTQRSGVSGSCERICATNADCPTGDCIATNLGSFCLPDDLGGAASCGSLQRATSVVGAPCAPASCPAGANICVDDGLVPGFCAASCTPGSCPADSYCGLTATGIQACIPTNCACAAGHGLGAAADAAMAEIWATTGLSPCDLAFEPRLVADVQALQSLLQRRTAVTDYIRYPLSSIERLRADSAPIASTGLTPHLESLAALAGGSLTLDAPTYTYPGPETPIAQATASLITAAGGSPNLAQLDADTQSIPGDAQAAIAPVISRVADVVTARSAALTQQFGTASNAQAAFDFAPYLFLPGTAAQQSGAQALRTTNFGADVGRARRLADDLVAATAPFGGLDADVQAMAAVATTSFGRLVLDTPAGAVVIADHAAQLHDAAAVGDEIAVLIDLGGDDTYTIPVGANASLENGVSIAIDLSGSDVYGYPTTADPNDDPALLESDADGRITPTLPLNQANGPVSSSDIARQGAGRLGIGMLFDLGSGTDTYRSLRMSQGAAVFGVGVLFDDGAATFAAEALAQGAAIGGFATIRADSAESNSYRVWHAGQGFGTLGGVGVAFDRAGDDTWLAEPGDGASVLYLSTVDRSVSNQNLAQGAGVGRNGELAGGLGFLIDVSGSDDYTAGTFAQGYGRTHGIGFAHDLAGDDTWNGRGVVQGAGEWWAGGLLRDDAGDDVYNDTTAKRLLGQGAAQTLAWGMLIDTSGNDVVSFLPSGGGVGIDGGFGMFLAVGGADTYDVASDASFGFAQIAASPGDPGSGTPTVGLFVDSGADADAYSRPTAIQNNSSWVQPQISDRFGVGLDR